MMCCLEKGGDLKKDFEDLNIPVYELEKRPGKDWTLYLKLWRLFNKKNIHIVHSHNSQVWLYSSIAAKIAGVSSIVHTQHANIPNPSRLHIFGCKLTASLTDVVVATSNQGAHFLFENINLSPGKTKVVYNAVEYGKYRDCKVDIYAKKTGLGINGFSHIVGVVGRLNHKKNHLSLIDAFHKVSKVFDTACLLIIGDGEMKSILKNRVAELGILDKVLFLGNRRDVPELLYIMDIFVLPSITEGLSMAILEAMASGLPVVATRVGGNPELVVDNETGILVPSNDPQALVQAISSLLSDEGLSKKMGMAGQKRLLNLFDVNRMALEYMTVYEKCLRN